MTRRGQAGVTLLELLIGIALTAMIVTPTTAWAIATLRQQQTAREVLGNTASSAFLSNLFTKDVATARVVDTSATDCLGGNGAGSGGQVKGWIETAGVTPQRIVYTEAVPRGEPASSNKRSLWRRVCDSTGHFVSANEVYDDVVPHSVTLECLSLAAPTASNCADVSVRQVRVKLTPSSVQTARAPFALLATRRVDANSIGRVAGLGNRPPSARVSVRSTVGHIHTSFAFSAGASQDIDGTISSYEWEFPNVGGATTGKDVTHTFSGLGPQSVVLKVTDNEGAVSVAVVTVQVFNLFPAAKASVAPATGTRGTTQFTFDAAGTVDPDNASEAITYEWDLGADLGADRYKTTKSFSFVFPAAATGGLRQITVRATDSHGDADTAVVQVGLDLDPAQYGSISTSPALVATPPRLPRVGSVGPGLATLPVTFSVLGADPSAPTQSSWQLARIGSPGIVASGTGATFSHVFGPTDAGQYRIHRVDQQGTTDVGVPLDFRVNSSPVAQFTSVGLSSTQTAPRTYQFTGSGAGGSSDADGTLVSFHWDLGFYGVWTSAAPNPAQEFPNPGDYPVTLTVTDDDGVSTTSVVQTLSLSGTAGPPLPPTWQGNSVLITAVPGATSYRVSVQCGGSPVASGDVVASAAPCYEFSNAACPAPGVASATVAVGIGATFTAPSTSAVRP